MLIKCIRIRMSFSIKLDDLMYVHYRTSSCFVYLSIFYNTSVIEIITWISMKALVKLFSDLCNALNENNNNWNTKSINRFFELLNFAKTVSYFISVRNCFVSTHLRKKYFKKPIWSLVLCYCVHLFLWCWIKLEWIQVMDLLLYLLDLFSWNSFKKFQHFNFLY